MSDDLYARLGVSRDADEKEIKKAYLKLAKSHHPDKGGSDEEFKKINEAYEVLNDGERRRMYDMTGSINPEEGGGGGGFPFGGMGMGDLFGMFGGMGGGPFGMGGGHGHGHGGPRQRVRRPKGPTKVHEVPLTIDDFYKGKRLEVKFDRHKFCDQCKGEGATQTTTCTECQGRGMVTRMGMMGPGMMVQMNGPCDACRGEGKKAVGVCSKCSGKKFQTQEKVLNVNIEQGMKPGDLLVFPNECSDQHEYDTPGDVQFVFQEADEEICWKRVGNDLKASVSIGLKESLLGCNKTFMDHPGFDQGLEVSLPHGVQNQEVVRVVGKGMPLRGKKDQFGDVLITVNVQPSTREKEILEKNKIMVQSMFT